MRTTTNTRRRNRNNTEEKLSSKTKSKQNETIQPKYSYNQAIAERAEELGRSYEAERKSRWEIQEARRLGRLIKHLSKTKKKRSN